MMHSIRSLLHNNTRTIFSAIAVSVGLSLILTGCASRANVNVGGEQSYPYRYQQAAGLAEQDESTVSGDQLAIREKFAEFEKLFAEFKQPDLRSQVESVYAEDLYFNDTLHSFSSRESMLAYMQATADRVNYTRVRIFDIISSGEDYFVRWSMDTGFTVMGKNIDTHSIGMTHIRFDESGRVNFHQDFWDNTEGLFRHLPVIGYLIEKTKNRL